MSLYLKSSKKTNVHERVCSCQGLRRLGSSDASCCFICFLAVPSFYDTAQVCFVVVSARHYPQQDVRLHYCSGNVAAAKRQPFHIIPFHRGARLHSQERHPNHKSFVDFFFKKKTLLSVKDNSDIQRSSHTFDQPAENTFGCCAVVVFFLVPSPVEKSRITRARAVTSAGRRRADFCQTISSSQTGAKRVVFPVSLSCVLRWPLCALFHLRFACLFLCSC